VKGEGSARLTLHRSAQNEEWTRQGGFGLRVHAFAFFENNSWCGSCPFGLGRRRSVLCLEINH
jgi:hypothetical protein